MPVQMLADATTAGGASQTVTTLAAALSLMGNVGFGTVGVWLWRQYEHLRTSSAEEQERLRQATLEALREAQEREDRAELREARAYAREQVYLEEIRQLSFRGVDISEDLQLRIERGEQRVIREWERRHKKPPPEEAILEATG